MQTDRKQENSIGQLLTIDQLAERLQVAKSWIYERTRTNTIPYKKIGKYVRFSESEIESWILAGCSLKFKSNAKRGS